MVCFTQTIPLQIFQRLSSTNFTWSFLQYFVTISFTIIMITSRFRDIARTPTTISEGEFCNNSQRFSVVDYCCKVLHLRSCRVIAILPIVTLIFLNHFHKDRSTSIKRLTRFQNSIQTQLPIYYQVKT